jgi:hypothetical protein
MTRGEGGAFRKQEPFLIALGGPEAHDPSLENKLPPPDFEWVAQVSL